MDSSTFQFNLNSASHGLEGEGKRLLHTPVLLHPGGAGGQDRDGSGLEGAASTGWVQSAPVWLESELEFGHEDPPESLVDDQSPLSL